MEINDGILVRINAAGKLGSYLAQVPPSIFQKWKQAPERRGDLNIANADFYLWADCRLGKCPASNCFLRKVPLSVVTW